MPTKLVRERRRRLNVLGDIEAFECGRVILFAITRNLNWRWLNNRSSRQQRVFPGRVRERHGRARVDRRPREHRRRCVVFVQAR